MRKHLVPVVIFAAVLACNGDSRNPVGLASPEPSPAIADATSGGREGFYFLQPIATNPKVAGPFDATLVPRARVCALNVSRTDCSAVIIATIPTGTGPGTLTVDPAGVFTGQWLSPSTLELSTVSATETRYRLEVIVDVGTMPVTLGYADLWIIDKQRDVKVSPAGFVDLVLGKTLVIRFGALPTTVGYVVVTPNPAEVAIGGIQQMTAAAYDLHNASISSASFAWSSDDNSVAAVSSAGLATGLANGSTTINAITGGVTGTAVINVIGDPPVAPTAVADEPAAGSAPGDAFHTAFNTNLNSAASGLLENDVRGTPLADVVSFGGGNLGGSVGDHAAGTAVNFGTGGSLQVNADGSFSFTPSSSFTGLFTFSYRIQNTSAPSDAPVSIAVGARPSAADDAYPVTIIGNVSINTASNSQFSLLANDAGDALTINVGASPNGDASINPDGTFTFNPSPGFTGTAIFSYTVQNGLGTSAPATVSIPVTTPIWFVNASAPAGGDGRLGSPFNCLVDAGAACYDDSANEPGDFMYLASGTYANAGALVLKATQRLIGQAATSSLATLTGLVNAADSPPLPSTGGTAPLMTSLAEGIVLASGNHLYGFNVGNTVGAGISGDAFGSLTARTVSFPGPTRTGQALGLSNGSLAGGATFATVVSTSGADVGISLVDVAGSFVVNGGTITNTTGSAAIVLSNVAAVTLSNMTIRDNAGSGIDGTNVVGFVLSQATMQNNGDDASEANIRMIGLTGTAGISSSTIRNASGENVLVQNSAGSLTFSLSGSTLSNDASEPDASSGLVVSAGGTSVINASVGNNTFQGHRLAHLRIASSNSGRMNISAIGNTLSCGNALATACNATFISSSDASFDYLIQRNVITGMKSALALNKNAGTGSMSGFFTNNTIGASGVAGSGGGGLFVGSNVDGVSHTTSITGNSIFNYSLSGIDVSAGSAGILHATVSANIIEEPSASAQHGVRAIAGNTPTSTAVMCVKLSSNLLNGSGPVADFRLEQGGLATMLLPFYGGANNDDAAVVAFVRSLQTLSTPTTPTGIASNTVAGGGGGFVGGADCSTP